MTTFAEEYERLYGKPLDFDPVTPGGGVEAPRVRLPGAPPAPDSAFTAAPVAAPESFEQVFGASRMPRRAKSSEPGIVGDFGRAFGAGVVGMAASGAGLLEYGARQLAADESSLAERLAAATVDPIAAARKAISGYSQDILENMSERDFDAIGREVMTLDPDTSIWRGGPASTGRAIALKVGQMLPATLAMIGGAGLAFAAGRRALAYAILSTEGLMSAGDTANAVTEEIELMSHEDLLKESPIYKGLIGRGSDEDAARRELTRQAQGAAPAIAGIFVGAVSAVAGKFLEPLFMPAGKGFTLGKRFTRGAISEGPLQEAPQGAVEQTMQNIASLAFDADRAMTEGVIEAAGEGALLGALTGGVVTSLVGRRPDRPTRPDRTAPPQGDPQAPSPTEQGELFGEPIDTGVESFEEVFGAADEPSTFPTMTPSAIDPALKAALDERMDSMYLPQRGEDAALDRQGTLNVTTPQPPPGGGAGQQLNLRTDVPLAGGAGILVGEEIQPEAVPEVTDYSTDLETPLGGDPRQGDLFDTQGEPAAGPTSGFRVGDETFGPDEFEAANARYEELVAAGESVTLLPIRPSQPGATPVTPSAEPVSDIEAQMLEMERPESNRTGVFLSVDNLENLQQQGKLEGLLERGVPLVNFDGQGGTLIAKDREAAEALTQEQQAGTPIDRIIGIATGAGVGKPPGGGTVVVQRRDESGNVVQEQLATNEIDAANIAEIWEKRFPNFDIEIRSAEAAISRRASLVKGERTRTRMGEQRVTAKKKRATTKARAEKRAVSATSKAAKLFGRAKQTAAKLAEGKIAGFYPPGALDFKNQREGEHYTRLFNRLVEQELILQESDAQAEEVRKRAEARTPKKVLTGFDQLRGDRRILEAERAPVEKARTEARREKGKLINQLTALINQAKPVVTQDVKKPLRKAKEVAPSVVSIAAATGATTATPPSAPTGVERTDLGARIEEEYEGEEAGVQPDVLLEEQKTQGDIEQEAVDKAETEAAKGEAEETVGLEQISEGEVPVGNVMASLEQERAQNEPEIDEELLYDLDANDIRDLTGRYLTFVYDHASRWFASRYHIVRDRTSLADLWKQYGKNEAGKRKLIRRVRNLLHGLEYGGGTKSLKFPSGARPTKLGFVVTRLGKRGAINKRTLVRTEEEATALINKWELEYPTQNAYVVPADKNVYKPWGWIKTTVLGRDVIKQDESEASQLTRERRYAKIRRELTQTLTRADVFVHQLGATRVVEVKKGKPRKKGRFTDIANERDASGAFTARTQNFIYAREYYSIIYRFGYSLVKSENVGTPIIEEMEKINKFLTQGMKLPHDAFARDYSKKLRATVQSGIRKNVRLGELRRKLADPALREEMNAELLKERLANLARIANMHLRKKNSLYNSHVVPLMLQFSDSYFKTGWASFVPKQHELEMLKMAMGKWENSNLRGLMFTPLKDYFLNAGITFEGDTVVIPLNENNEYEYSPSDKLLDPRFTQRYGKDVAGSVPSTVSQQVSAETGQLVTVRRPGGGKRPVLEFSEEGRDRAAEVEQYGRYVRANVAIRAFREFVSKKKTTIMGFIRAEQKLIDALRGMDLWRDSGGTNDTMGSWMGAIARSGKIYRPIRNRIKSLTKEEAREALLRIKEIAFPKALSPGVKTNLASVEETAQREIDELTTLFNLATDPGPHITEFNAVALGLANQINDGSTPTTLGELLTIIVNGIPDGHMYRDLAGKLLDLGISDLTVNWDERGQLKGQTEDGGDALGGAFWDDIPGDKTKHFRYVLLNRARVMEMDDPQGSLIHTFLHEAVHMATLDALETNGTVRRAAMALQEAGRKHYIDRGVPNYLMPYAFRAKSSVAEFIAEAFSNASVQADLKRIKLDRGGTQGQTPVQSLWTKLVQLVKNLLGAIPIVRNVPGVRGSGVPETAYEAVMDLQHKLFTGEDRMTPTQILRGAGPEFKRVGREDFVAMDSTLQGLSDHVTGSIGRSFQGLGEAWAQAKKMGIRAPLGLMTELQLHHEFRRFFGAGTNNPYDRRHAAWEKRQSEEAALTKEGGNISVEWEALNEKHGLDATNEFSYLRTAAKQYGMHINLPLSHELNSHITTAKMKALHRELSERYQAMGADVYDDGWKNLWSKVSKFYKGAREKEGYLNLMNAMRGMVTTEDAGNSPIMTREKFASTYTVEAIKRLELNTVAGLKKEFPTMRPETVTALATLGKLPTLEKGPYSPSSRYGDYVVYAKRTTSQRMFKSKKEAIAYALDVEANDPTLDTTKHDLGGNQWQVDIIEKDFRTAETVREAAMKRSEMIEQYGKDNVTDVQLKREYISQDMIKNSSTLDAILSKLDDARAQNALKDWWLQHLADSSFRKNEIRFQHRRGIDFHLQHRNFVNYVQRSAHHRAHLKYGWEMADAERDMQAFVNQYKAGEGEPPNERIGKVLAHIKKRNNLDVGPASIGRLVKKGTELGQVAMLVGPSFWMINLSQPWIVTLPWLGARYGYGASRAALSHAQGLIADPLLTATKDSLAGLKALRSKAAANKAFDVLEEIKSNIRLRAGEEEADRYLSMLDELTSRSGLELTQIGELRDISEGIDSSTWGRIMDAGRIMSHITEVNNRVLTSIATYNLAHDAYLKEHRGDMEGAHREGVDRAHQAVNTTQFGYSAANKPYLFQPGGPFGRGAPLIFQFLQWPQHMYAMLIGHTVAAVNQGTIDRKTALKTLGGLMATHMAVGGAIGVALQPVKWAVGAMLWALGDDDDPNTFVTVASGETFDRWTREGLTEAFGQRIGHALASGIPAALGGPDLSDRMSMGTVYFLDLKTETSESTVGSLLMAFGGPMVTITTNAGRGLGMLANGEVAKGIQFMIPSKMLKDLVRTYRYAQEGLVNNAGDTILDASSISFAQLFMQASGFRPAEISDYYSRQALIKDTEFYGTNRKAELLKRYRTAKTIEDSNRVLEEISAFNEVFPYAYINRSALIRTLRGKKEREVSHQMYGASLKGRARILGGEGDYYGNP